MSQYTNRTRHKEKRVKKIKEREREIEKRTNRDRKSSCLCLALQILTDPHGPDIREACFRHGMKNKKGNCVFFLSYISDFFLGFARDLSLRKYLPPFFTVPMSDKPRCTHATHHVLT